MIRVLIADDSPTQRALLAAMLADEADLAVVASADDGARAVELCRQARPDVVVMDVHMPGIDGYEATRRIMAEAPTPIVICSEGLRTREVEYTLEALRAGALTAISKPPGPTARDFEDARARFVQTIRAMAGVKVVRRWTPSAPATSPRRPVGPPPPPRASLVAVGASTGGPAVLHEILGAVGPGLAPVLLVQHMAPGFVDGLATWLAAATRLRVVVARDGETVAPGCVYVAPDGRHLTLAGPRTIRLLEADPVDGFRPSATVLFRSVAEVVGADALGVILTGMGSDGLAGLRELRRAGGRVVAQDEKSSVVFGMPGAVVEAGLADEVLPPAAIARRLVEVAGGRS